MKIGRTYLESIRQENKSNRIEAICNFVGNWDYWIYDKRHNKLIAILKTTLSSYKGLLS